MQPLRTPRRPLALLLAALWLLAAAGVAAAAGKDDDDDGDSDDWADKEKKESPLSIHGFVETAVGGRVVKDSTQPGHLLLGEGRFRLEVGYETDLASASFKGDFLADGVSESVSIDIREAIVLFSKGPLTLRAGRQVLTWGTGDLLFLNDLFPKDWVSFLAGRQTSYLKAPSTSIKVTLASRFVSLDVVWTPIFEHDRFIDGSRMSFYSPLAGTRVGGGDVVDDLRPSKRFENGEFAGRLYRRVGSYELALYGYFGFNKQPLAFDPAQMRPTYARMWAYGASVRGPLFGGLVNVEGSFYQARDDPNGRDPNVPNHEVRGLIGYEHELAAKLTLGVQYYLEAVLQHDRLLAASPDPAHERPALRHVATARVTWRLLRDDLTLSLFGFVEPSKDGVDVYLRPSVMYKFSDALGFAVGANVILSKRDYTFFGQLRKNSNVYGRARFTF